MIFFLFIKLRPTTTTNTNREYHIGAPLSCLFALNFFILFFDCGLSQLFSGLLNKKRKSQI